MSDKLSNGVHQRTLKHTYLQETGLAGRIGLHADAILYYGPGQL